MSAAKSLTPPIMTAETITMTSAAADTRARGSFCPLTGADALAPRHQAESGCNGYMYELDYIWLGDEGGPEGGPLRLRRGVTICVAAGRPGRLVRGTEIDYVTEGLNSSLQLQESQCHRPNAAAARAFKSVRCGERSRGLTNQMERPPIMAHLVTPGPSPAPPRPGWCPPAAPVSIPGGAFVTLTQTLGGNACTVVYDGNMARIDGEMSTRWAWSP